MTPAIARLDVAEARRADAETARAVDIENANATAKHRRAVADRKTRFASWDNLTQSDEFALYLYERQMRLESVYVPPPRASEAEWCAIGAMLKDARAVEIGLGPLRREMFGETILAHALTAIAAIKKRNALGTPVEIDCVTVTGEMRRRKTFTPNTFSLLVSCAQDCPSSSNMPAYVVAIINASKQNYLLKLGRYVADCAQGKDEKFPYYEPELIASCTRRALDAIEAKGFADLDVIFSVTK